MDFNRTFFLVSVCFFVTLKCVFGSLITRNSLSSEKEDWYNFEFEDPGIGWFKGRIHVMNITGFENLLLLNFSISTSPPNIGIRNMTVLVPEISVKGTYDLNGSLIFPMGYEAINVFGKGDFGIKIGKPLWSMKLFFKTKAGIKIVKDLDITFHIQTADVKLENLMGGGILEDIFNGFFTHLGPTILEYYNERIKYELKNLLIALINNELKDLSWQCRKFLVK